MNNNDNATMTITAARRIADTLRDTRIYRDADTIILAHDTLDYAMGTPIATREDFARIGRLREAGNCAF